MLTKILLIIAFFLSSFASSEEIQSGVGADIGISIMGTIVQKEKGSNVVLLKEIETGKVQAYRAGHQILKKYRILDIASKFIIVQDGGSKLRVYQDKFASEIVAKNSSQPLPRHSDSFSEEGFERKAGKIKMTAMYREKLVKQDLSKILMQSTAQPYMEDGSIVGFQLSQIDADSIYEKSGLRDNDIITSINDIPLNNVSGAIKLLHSLKKTDRIDIIILRDGAEQQITIDID